MITVEEAEQTILGRLKDFGTESAPFEECLGRVLAEDLTADRDLPPYNRVTMDGIAVSYKALAEGRRSFRIKAVQAAGDPPVDVETPDECVEIMTGAALSATLDTVIRYEDLDISEGSAWLKIFEHKEGQNVHTKGRDKKQGDVVAKAGQIITPAIISLAASVGQSSIVVKKLPRIVVLSSGDELVDVGDTPLAYQVRRSNNYTIKAILQQRGVEVDLLHIPDDLEFIQKDLQRCLQHYDVILLSGGISMGKFDHVPQALENIGVKKLFHKVLQRPGKPFWFGEHTGGTLVFAFPGNPVATFMCLHRYFLLWLNATLGVTAKPTVYAQLAEDYTFTPALKYFLQVKLTFTTSGLLLAYPVEGNGSGDFANLADTDAFMELPMERDTFKAGEAFRVHLFNSI